MLASTALGRLDQGNQVPGQPGLHSKVLHPNARWNKTTGEKDCKKKHSNSTVYQTPLKPLREWAALLPPSGSSKLLEATYKLWMLGLQAWIHLQVSAPLDNKKTMIKIMNQNIKFLFFVDRCFFYMYICAFLRAVSTEAKTGSQVLCNGSYQQL